MHDDQTGPVGHTPGPWLAGKPSSVVGWPVVSPSAGGRMIANITFAPGHQEFNAASGANARLIAAAPTMLQALRMLTLMARTSGGTAGKDADLKVACRQAEAAIALATGSTGRMSPPMHDDQTGPVSKTFLIEGSSDDTFGDVGRHGDDYDNCANGEPIVWRIATATESLLVWGQYAPTEAYGGWVIGVGPDDCPKEERPIPAWPMRLGPSDHEYSPRLTIEAPTDAVMTLHFPRIER